MTLEEAKKILEKEFAVINLHKSTEPFEFDDSNWFGYEKPSVLEAFRVLSKEGYYVAISGHDYDMRKKRLEKEYEKNTKAPGPGEEQSKEGNPALKEAASQFNDALLDEQAKKIEELTKEKTNLEDQITILDACKKHNENFGRKQIKRLGKEVSKLNSIIHDKNAVLSDVAEELRLSKIREKNLTEVCQKYMKEIEELRKELADKVVDKIDAQALKSAESALAYKESYIEKLKKEIAERTYYIKEKYEEIDKLTKENNDYKKVVEEFRNKIADMTIGKIDIQNIHLKEKNKEIKELNDKLKSINMNRHNERVYKKQLSEKDEVIDDLDKELEATKNELEEKNYLIDMLRCGSREYCEYGIAAEKMIQKMAKVIVKEGAVSSEDFKEYRRLANGYRFNPQLPDFSEEEEKKLEHAKKIRVSSDNAEEGADLYGVIVLCGKDYIDALKKAKDADYGRSK